MKRILALLAVLAVWSTSVFGQDELVRIKELTHTDSVYVPALLQAILQGETETVKTLIKEGEDVNEYWYYREDDPFWYIGYTPLELATILGNLDIMRLLLDNGANPDRLVDGYLDMPALMYAENAETTQLFIDHGADIHAEYDGGGTPLHIADNAEVAKILIDYGADIDGQSVLFGNMPLHAASYRGKKDVVQVLLDHGADVNAKDIDGRTPLDIAIDRGRTEIAALLREHGGVTTNVTTK